MNLQGIDCEVERAARYREGLAATRILVYNNLECFSVSLAFVARLNAKRTSSVGEGESPPRFLSTPLRHACFAVD